MREVIYIGTGIIVVFINVVNAGCCGDKTGKSNKLELKDIKIKDYKGVDDDITKDDDTFDDLSGVLVFGKDDISKNVTFFNKDEVYVCVFNEAIYNKQSDEAKKNNIQKLCNTSYYIACILCRTRGFSFYSKDSVKISENNGEFSVEASD